jgi:hypothetical protein
MAGGGGGGSIGPNPAELFQFMNFEGNLKNMSNFANLGMGPGTAETFQGTAATNRATLDAAKQDLQNQALGQAVKGQQAGDLGGLLGSFTGGGGGSGIPLFS